jgi:hypothetical protein
MSTNESESVLAKKREIKPSQARKIWAILFGIIGLILLISNQSGDYSAAIFFIALSLLLFLWPSIVVWLKKAGIIRPPQAFASPEERAAHTKERERKFFIKVGKFARPLIIIGIIIWAFSTMPSIGNVPISQLTLADIAGLIVHIILGFTSIFWLFRGSKDEFYEGWGYFGMLVVASAIIGYFYFQNHP